MTTFTLKYELIRSEPVTSGVDTMRDTHCMLQARRSERVVRTVNTKCAADNAMHVLKNYPHTSVFRGLVSSYLKVNIRISRTATGHLTFDLTVLSRDVIVKIRVIFTCS